MTFYEAAIEVLFKAGRPLHYKKITEAAIQEKLLSHVGKTPEVTMGERLNQEIKKQDDSPVVSVRPGVYALREEYAKELQARPAPEPKAAPVPAEVQTQAPQANGVAVDVPTETESNAPSPEDRASRRRRRRGSRNSSQDRAETPDAASPARTKSNGARRRKSSSSSRRSSGRRPSRNQKQTPRTNGRSTDGAAKPRETEAAPSRPTEQKHLNEGPVRLDGIAEAAHVVLKDSDKKAMKVKELADEIFKRKLVRFHTHDAATTVQAAVANDNQIRNQRGHRPLFVQYDRDRWGLSEWGLSAPAIRKEQQILSLSEEIRQDAIQELGKALVGVKPEALEHLALTLLERLGYRNIKVSKRSSEGDVYFTGDWRQGLSDVRVCIEVVGDNAAELQEAAVTDLRSTLHHYSASEGVIIHLGSISQSAIKESREEKLAPITLIDRTTFVDQLLKRGIGVKTYHTPIMLVDLAFIDALSV